MDSQLQTALATLITAAASSASGYVITLFVKSYNAKSQLVSLEDNYDIPNVLTFESKDTLDSDYKDKLLDWTRKTNLPFLVKTKDETNQKWWKWAFINKFNVLKDNSKLHTTFQNIDTFEKLKNTCETAYTQNKDQYKFEDSNYLLKNISTFCTKGTTYFDISEPKVVVFGVNFVLHGNYPNGLLNNISNREHLAKPRGENDINELWWKWSYKYLFTNDLKNESHEIFKKVTKAFDNQAEDSGNDPTSLNKACKKAYKQNKEELKKDRNKLFNNVAMFCSIGREPAKLTELTK